MPIAGFKKGQKVLTPSGHRAEVLSAVRIKGREVVTVDYLDIARPHREFDASALRPQSTS